MPRPATGSIIETTTAAGVTYGARFRAYGERRYVKLGTAAEGWTRSRAEDELAFIMAQVERGLWQPPAPAPVPAAASVPTFHELASEWFAAREREWSPATRADYRWQLTDHLLPAFAAYPVDAIDVAAVDAYRERKMREYERTLAARETARAAAVKASKPVKLPPVSIGPPSINKTITRLGQILDVALERDVILRNPVRVNARNRRVKYDRKRRAYLDRPEQLAALIDAASLLDAQARADRRSLDRRLFISTLLLAGPRITEALALTWRDAELREGRLRVRGTKTGAAERYVPLVPVLAHELRRARPQDADPDALIFATRAGRRLTKDNTRDRVLLKAVGLASELLEAQGHAPLPDGLTHHSLRHTYISWRLALGDPLPDVAEAAGHAGSAITGAVYSHPMRLDADARAQLRRLVYGTELRPVNSQVWPSDAPDEGKQHRAA